MAATFKLTPGTKLYNNGAYEGAGEVKGRGNTSWNFAQKPYSIKLASKASLLDIPKTKKYAIISPEADPTLLRNYMTYKTGLELDGIGYTPKVELVEAYLNGSYNGIYALVERIAIESGKIDIEEVDVNGENLTGGYLIEKDAGDKVNWNGDPLFECPYQANPNDDVFTVQAPDDPSQEVLDYLTAYMKRVHGAIMGTSGEDYTRYVDTDSWVDFVIMQEISKNIDGNLKTSCYMYKEADNDKLYMTALWDFDNAYGNAGWDNKAPGRNDVVDCPSGTGTEDFMVINSSCPWYQKLYTIPAFRQALQEKYTQYRHTLVEDMFVKLDAGAAYLADAVPGQNEKWNRVGNHAERVAGLRSWLEGRLKWLDSQWLLDVPATHNVTVTVTGAGSAEQVGGAAAVADRGTADFTLVPDKGGKIASVTFGGIDVTARVVDGKFTTPILTADAELEVVFEKAGTEHNIYPLITAQGSITPAEPWAAAGETVRFTVEPKSGYQVDEVYGVGAASGERIECTPAEGEENVYTFVYTFVMPDEDVNLAARFSKISEPETTYTVRVETGKGGGVSPESQEVTAGGDAAFTLSLEPGCVLGKIEAPEGAVYELAGDRLIVKNVQGDLTLKIGVVVKGDLSGDGDVNVTDVMACCKVLARKAVDIEPEEDEILRGDLNGDGMVDITDVMALCKLLAAKAAR